MSIPIPVIDIAGSPYEMGRTHGETLQNHIVEFVESVTAVHQENNAWLQANKDQLLAFSGRNRGFIQEFAPEYIEEMQGIADGAGVSFDDILYLNSFLELEEVRAPGLGGAILPKELWGCTTFNITADAAADGRARIGQTYDMERYYKKFLVLLRVQPENGPSALVLTFAGILGLAGLNSASIGAVINKIAANDARPGVPYPCIIRRALASERIGDALGAVVYSRRAGGLNYQLAGADLAFCAETSATYYQLIEIDGALAHTNHYLSPAMRPFETPNWLSHGGTMVRKQVADAFLKKHRGAITPDLLKELTRDHTNHPRCICAHGFPDEGENTAFETVFAVIMDPAAGTLEACAGNPCENAYERYSLQA